VQRFILADRIIRKFNFTADSSTRNDAAPNYELPQSQVGKHIMGFTIQPMNDAVNQA
jgi:hypothetical protein